jgi:hypothetical protein
MLNYTNITQNTYIQSWTVTEIKAREVWNIDSCYTFIDYQIHIKTGRTPCIYIFFPILHRASLLDTFLNYCRYKFSVIKLVAVYVVKGSEIAFSRLKLRNSMFCTEECFEEKLCILIRLWCGQLTSIPNKARFLLGSYKTKLNSAINV